jgi:hypothetical protein
MYISRQPCMSDAASNGHPHLNTLLCSIAYGSGISTTSIRHASQPDHGISRGPLVGLVGP